VLSQKISCKQNATRTAVATTRAQRAGYSYHDSPKRNAWCAFASVPQSRLRSQGLSVLIQSAPYRTVATCSRLQRATLRVTALLLSRRLARRSVLFHLLKRCCAKTALLSSASSMSSTEGSVGISAWANSLPGFTGILKQRYVM